MSVIKRSAGFTLIEMAILVLVFGLLVVGFFSLYNVYNKSQINQANYQNIDTIRQALAEYQFYTGHYPVPSGLALKPGDSFFGYCPVNTGGQAGDTCAAPSQASVLPGGCNSAGICRLQSTGDGTVPFRDYDGDGNADTILMGAVPYKTLMQIIKQTKLSQIQTLDSWNNKIIYIVSEGLTNANYNPAHGLLRVIDEHDQNILTPGDSAHYILLSMGEDGKGAYSNSGVRAACPTSSGTEFLNCGKPSATDKGSTFRSALRSLSAGANYFDDVILPVGWSNSALWASSSDSPGSAYNTNAGKVGVNTKTPQNDYDVNGTLGNPNASGPIKTLTTKFCDSVGNNCYDISKIAGNDSSMKCGNNEAVTGIGYRTGSNAHSAVQVECAPAFTTTISGTCASNEYVNAYSSVHGLYCCTSGTNTCHWLN